MDKETLSHYGWIVVLVLIISVMLALASPLGMFIADGFKASYNGFFDVNSNAMDIAGIVTGGPSADPALNPSGIVPEGGEYIDADGNRYKPGEKMPEEVKMGDAYYYGDYIYRYNQTWYSTGSSGYSNNESQNGWGVFYRAYKAVPGEILESINEKPITNLGLTFWLREFVTQAPRIPQGTTSLHRTFEGTSITEMPEIPKNVVIMDRAFAECKFITTVKALPEGVKELSHAFSNCTQLTKITNIPSTTTRLWRTFENCVNLTDLSHLVIPKGIESTQETFLNCTSLTKAPKLEYGVTNLSMTFWGCTSLTDDGLPELPDTMRGITQAFVGCTSLVDLGDYVIPERCMYTNSTFKNCTSLRTAPIISGPGYYELDGTHYYRYLSNMFENCTSLTGIVTINTGSQFYDEMFKGIDFEAQNLTLKGSAYFLDYAGKSGSNYCEVCNGRHMKPNEEHICHGGETATCTQKSICMICNNEYGEFAPHNGGTATCSQKAICTTCGNEYGELKLHTIHNNACSNCGQTGLAIESEHSPYSNNINNVVLGTWDYSDAKSVTITITYQTESTSYDWVYLKSGDNYIDLSGNVTSTATKIGGTTKTTKTFTTTALTGSVTFRTDGSGNNYYGVKITVSPNY